MRCPLNYWTNSQSHKAKQHSQLCRLPEDTESFTSLVYQSQQSAKYKREGVANPSYVVTTGHRSPLNWIGSLSWIHWGWVCLLRVGILYISLTVPRTSMEDGRARGCKQRVGHIGHTSQCLQRDRLDCCCMKLLRMKTLTASMLWKSGCPVSIKRVKTSKTTCNVSLIGLNSILQQNCRQDRLADNSTSYEFLYKAVSLDVLYQSRVCKFTIL